MQVTSQFLQDNLFSNFEKVFGKNDAIDVIFSTTKKFADGDNKSDGDNSVQPALHISKAEDSPSYIEAADVSLRIMNPFSQDLEQGYEVAIIRGSARAEVDFQLVLDSNDDSKYELVAKLRNANLKVADMKTYFDSELVEDENDEQEDA